MRKQSPETQVRHLKREVKFQDARIGAILRELDERRRIGAMLSNICYNLSQRDSIPGDDRETMKVCYDAWGGIKRDGK